MRRLCLLFLLSVSAGACADGTRDGGWLPTGPELSTATRASAVSNPLVTGPIPAPALPGSATHEYPFFATPLDLAGQGYVEEEFLFEGTARRYALPELSTGTVVDEGHPFRTRMIVRRPVSASAFNGTVLLEWQNVTVGHDFDGLWLASADHIMRRGYAWIGVSVEWWGVQLPGFGLSSWNPVRYGTLDVTEGWTILDDALAYDIFSQAAQAVRRPEGTDPMGGLSVKRVVAAGISRAANCLALYHNSVHPLTEVIDAYLLIGGGGLLRTDLTVPVFKLLSETGVVGTLMPQAPLRQLNSDHFRRWEVAGASHLPYHVMQNFVPVRTRDLGPLPLPVCDQPYPSRIPGHFVLNAAMDHLVEWVKHGTEPPTGPDIELEPGPDLHVARDANGNALGGIQLSQHAVPTAMNSGVNGPVEDGWCVAFGTSLPFTQERLEALYPSHQAYLSRVIKWANHSRRAGYIVGHDAAEAIAEAARSDIGRR